MSDTTSAAPISLDWRRVDAWVATRKRDAKSKQVLHGCWGTAAPGRVLALMGPSGSGKTTLLNILADRPTLGSYGSWTGDVLASGRTQLPKRSIGYVMQKDLFFADLTVREHLKCTAALRLPEHWTEEAREAELARIVSLLRLESALDTFVGGGSTRGISGGELKRLNIATELLALPQLLVLDEPLSGLDSNLADIVVGALVATARDAQTTVLLSVHQPSPAAWQQFDDLLLLSAPGRTAFFGPRADAVRVTAAALHVAEPSERSAEWLVDVVSEDESGQREVLVAAFAALPVPAGPPAGVVIATRPRPPWLRTCAALFQRQFANMRRREMKRLEWILTFGLSVVFAGVYFRVGADKLERQKDYISILFFFVAHWSFHPVFKTIGSYPRQRDVLTRERASDSYPISAWFVANVLGDWCVAWAHPLIFYCISWPIAAMPIGRFGVMYCVTMLNYEVFSALGSVIAAWVFDGERARIVVVVVMVFEMLSGGFFVNLQDARIPPWLSSMHYLSIQTYTFGLYVSTALTSDEYAAFGPTLVKYSFSKEPALVNVCVLAGTALILRLIAYVSVLHSKQLKFS